MRRVRAGAYVEGDYLIRYFAWLGSEWDRPREQYRPWHVFRRASQISSRILLDTCATRPEAERFVAQQIALDRQMRAV